MPRMREDGKLKGEKKGSPGRNAQGFGRSLRWEVSRPRKGCGTSPRGECWKTRELCPGKAETCSGNPKPCTKTTLSAVGCGWTWEGKEEEREAERGSQTRRKQQWKKRGAVRKGNG